LTWVQHSYGPHAAQSDVHIEFSDIKHLQINVGICVFCTMCYFLGGIICRGCLRPLLQVYTKQDSAHREGGQDMNLLHFGLIPLSGPGSMGCNVQSFVQYQLNIPFGLRCSHPLLTMPNTSHTLASTSLIWGEASRVSF
jgi:hypothetical protein